jgi:hypothetical protein
MKNIVKYIGFFTFLSFVVGANMGCGLSVQKPYEYEPEVLKLVDFKDKTVWDWLQTQKTPDTAKVKAGNKFDFMIDAITYAGLEEEYKSGSNQTYILLSNSAFTAANEINFALTGKVAGPITTADKVRLANLLKSHIVTAYVDQIKALPVWGTSYEFNTKGTGANSKMYINRNERYFISLNGSTDLPTTKKAVTIVGHNYVFSNGIGHIANTHARLVAF